MMVKLTSWSGAPLYISSQHVLALEPDIKPGRTVIRFALLDNPCSAGLSGLVSETVQGTPEEVAALLNGCPTQAARDAMFANAKRVAVAIDGDPNGF